MKHTKRMVLIPEDALHRYEQRQRLDTAPITSNMMQKDTDMSNVLQRSDIDDDEKQKLYHANLERYLNLRRQKDDQIPSVRITPESKEKPVKMTRLPDATIVEHIPQDIRSRATALLTRLKARPDVISWDDSGEVKLEGETIPQSNISDLISDAVRGRKNFDPTGAKEFFRVLSKMNVPRDLVRNEGRWKQLGDTSDSVRKEGRWKELSDTSDVKDLSSPRSAQRSSKRFWKILRSYEERDTPKRWLDY